MWRSALLLLCVCYGAAFGATPMIQFSTEFWQNTLLGRIPCGGNATNPTCWVANCSTCAVFLHFSYARAYLQPSEQSKSLKKIVVDIVGDCPTSTANVTPVVVPFCVVAPPRMQASRDITDSIWKHLAAFQNFSGPLFTWGS